MSPIQQVVVPIDRSDRSLRALPAARLIADFVGADVVAASVVAKPTDRGPMERDLASRLADRGDAVSDLVVVVGRDAIADRLEPVIGQPGVLVVVATDGHSRTVAFTGSVAEELVHARPGRFTVLVGPSVDLDDIDLAGPMILCRHPDRPSPGSEALAGSLARQFVMKHIVLSIRRTGRFRPGSGPTDRGLDEADDAVILSDTDPTRSIIGYADEVGASLIAVGTHRRIGLSRMAFGSVAIQTVTAAPCPVLAIPEIG